MKKRKVSLNKKKCVVCIDILLVICIFASTVSFSGCETRKQSGTLAGAGIGALAGQMIGGNTQATLIGAAIGAGAGHIIGNKQDKEAAEQYDMNQPTPLTGTKWKVVSMVKMATANIPRYTAIFVEFTPNGEVVTTRHEAGGTMVMTEERYRISGDTLIINKPGYMINAKYKISGNRMTVDCLEFNAILERVA